MFKDKVVVITGAAKGIGKGIAEAFVEKEAIVHIVDIDKREGEFLEEVLNKKGANVLFHHVDVGKLNEVTTMMKEIKERDGKIDILVNNAGLSEFKSIWEVTEHDWSNLLKTNLSSVFYCSREAAKYMKDKGGSIINMASTRATMSEPNTEAYSASKGGITAITHALSITLSKYQIRVNSISPGWIETNEYSSLREIDHTQHPANRVGKPSDVAKSCLYLADPTNDFVTGIDLVVDGGMVRKMIYEH
jgi:NAD(P)-dependent dehydrogenase (short-subunit alcohol dehydrogenase family)